MPLFKPSPIPWDQMTESQKRQEMMRKFDSLGKSHRAFINEYGDVAYVTWRQLRVQRRVTMREFEIVLRREMGLSPTAPVADEFKEYN